MNREELIQHIAAILQVLRRYHRHEVVGMEHIPTKGRALLVFNHSLATYDMALLFGTILETRKRFPRPLADHLFFKIPYLGQLIEAFGATEGTQDNAKDMLASENLVAVAPGGMREAIRPSEERYQIRWEKRKGFVRLAIQTQTPIILAICPKADDLYDVYPNPLTLWAYKTLKLPLVLARGFGLSPIPKPIKLVHYVDEPILPPPMTDDPVLFKKEVNKLHRKVIKRAELLMARAVSEHRVEED